MAGECLGRVLVSTLIGSVFARSLELGTTLAIMGNSPRAHMRFDPAGLPET